MGLNERRLRFRDGRVEVGEIDEFAIYRMIGSQSRGSFCRGFETPGVFRVVKETEGFQG